MYENDLKSCPVCGSKGEYNNDVGLKDEYYVTWIECTNQKCRIKTPEYSTSQESINHWNRLWNLVNDKKR